jgi:hypothetical protein
MAKMDPPVKTKAHAPTPGSVKAGKPQIAIQSAPASWGKNNKDRRL